MTPVQNQTHIRTPPKKISRFYMPHKGVAVDKAMCGWVADSNSRFIERINPLLGEFNFTSFVSQSQAMFSDLRSMQLIPKLSNKPMDVVLRLMDPLLDKSFHVFTDNYYTCPALTN
ncbi:hypothetical protein PoB_002937400 [Plakobranchus ocellatus]|uniref:PiggyBac transposable element-derived protein domain-containing protein n=1 Tax=Plakobranchus ocellatus TaxID=259542 RepID=A0AAV4A5A7_9GAST|nr:hypothetical protein PoB_002937400 [Plakobranchus ocellatus]